MVRYFLIGVQSITADHALWVGSQDKRRKKTYLLRLGAQQHGSRHLHGAQPTFPIPT